MTSVCIVMYCAVTPKISDCRSQTQRPPYNDTALSCACVQMQLHMRLHQRHQQQQQSHRRAQHQHLCKSPLHPHSARQPTSGQLCWASRQLHPPQRPQSRVCPPSSRVQRRCSSWPAHSQVTCESLHETAVQLQRSSRIQPQTPPMIPSKTWPLLWSTLQKMRSSQRPRPTHQWQAHVWLHRCYSRVSPAGLSLPQPLQQHPLPQLEPHQALQLCPAGSALMKLPSPKTLQGSPPTPQDSPPSPQGMTRRVCTALSRAPARLQPRSTALSARC